MGVLFRPSVGAEDKSADDVEMKVLLSLSTTVTVFLDIHIERLCYIKTICLTSSEC